MGALQLRNNLAPYIYTQARIAFDTGVAIVHPLYYDYPEVEQAYSYSHQYMFGDDIFVSPVTTAVDKSTNRTAKTIWFPPGHWVDFFGLKTVTGPAESTLSFGMADIPAYVRAGAIIPMKTMASVTDVSPDPLQFVMFPGANQASTIVYEDDGYTLDYQKGQFAKIGVAYQTDNINLKVTISAVIGQFTGMVNSRAYHILVKGAAAPKSVMANGVSVPESLKQTSPGWWMDSSQMALIVALPPMSVHTDIGIAVTF